MAKVRLAGWYGVGKHAARADSDLERRRRAIVRALRGELDRPAAPAPATAPTVLVSSDQLNRLERDVAAVRGHLAELSARLHRVVSEVTHARSAPAYPGNPAVGAAAGVGAVTAGSSRSPDGEDDPMVETPWVPPMEPVAPMSDTASRALFGY